MVGYSKGKRALDRLRMRQAVVIGGAPGGWAGAGRIVGGLRVVQLGRVVIRIGKKKPQSRGFRVGVGV